MLKALRKTLSGTDSLFALVYSTELPINPSKHWSPHANIPTYSYLFIAWYISFRVIPISSSCSLLWKLQSNQLQHSRGTLSIFALLNTI